MSGINGISHHEVGVVMLIEVIEHTYGVFGQAAEHATAILVGNDSLTSRSHRMPLLRSIKRVRFRLPHRDMQSICLRIIVLHNTVQLYAWMIFAP